MTQFINFNDTVHKFFKYKNYIIYKFQLHNDTIYTQFIKINDTVFSIFKYKNDNL